MTNLSKRQIIEACRLHDRSLIQAKKHAVTVGWTPDFVDQVANLEWSLHDLQRLKQRGDASAKQLNAILAVRDSAMLEMAGSFAKSQF